MDETIRFILQNALHGEKKEESLMNAYSRLKRGQQPSDQSHPFTADVYVICAEAAYQLNKFNVAEDCLKMFFQKAESGNECLGRAYICQSKLNQPESAKFPEQLDKCSSFLLKAISFGKGNKKHHYLVYNGSVLYWSFARPFLKPNCQHLLAKTLHQIVKALDDTDDKDYEWRAQLMISLIECYLDGGKKEDASQVSVAAASFAKAYCPQMYKLILSLQIQHKLIDQSKLLKDSKQSTDIAIYLRILKLKSLIDSGEKVDVDGEVDRLYKTIINDGIEPQGTSSRTRLSQMTSNGPIAQSDKSSLLLDLIKFCLEYERVALAEEYIASTIGAAKNPVVALEIEFLKSEIIAQQLKEKKSQYTKASVEKRMNAIRKLEDSLSSAIRLEVPTLIQAGCVTMWNLCLPLLQKDFRKAIKAPLNLVAVALAEIDSLLLLIRCQIHIELAKCEEDNEQLEPAMNHLQKALSLDDTGIYGRRIERTLHRLQLRSMLYELPDRPEDIAALIIEQARTTKEAGKLQMKRAALVKAGLALASDTFGLLMDGENGLHLGRNAPTSQQQLEEKVTRYCKSIGVVTGHIQRLGNENDSERVQIWADLVKTARKQNVWDVTRVAAKFCLLYDDGRWEGAKRESSSKDESKGTAHAVNGNASHSDTVLVKRSATEIDKQLQDDADLMQVIAEVHFIHAEALVQLLKSEGVNLFENPTPIEDSSTKPKSQEGKVRSIENTKEWIAYSAWLQSLCNDALEGFHRGAKLGAQLNAPWLISNAGIYLWNYVNHILAAGDFAKLVKVFQPVYDDLKVLGYLEDIAFFCEFAHALACGYMQPYLPNATPTTPVPGEKDKKGRNAKHSASPTLGKNKLFVPSTDPDAVSDLKQALEILEHALNLTNGNDARCLVTISNRQVIIKTWVLCKLLSGQMLPKNLGHDDESPDSQGPMSRALCAIEALALQQKYGFDTTNCPGLFEIIKLVENCKWTNRLVEIESWTRLACLAAKSQFCQVVIQCGEKALELGKLSKPVKFDKLSDSMKHQYVLEQELLYYSSALIGENLVEIMHGRNETRHKALNHFYGACRFAAKARNYQLTLSAAQRYWNTCQYFILTPLERKLLKGPIKGILDCITDVWKYSDLSKQTSFRKDEESSSDHKEGGELTGKKSDATKIPGNNKKSSENIKVLKKGSSSGKQVRIGTDQLHEELEGPVSLLDSHLSLRAALYGVLFQAYADRGEWQNGLKAMDEAIRVMPKTRHRLLIFKHRVIVNARLGKPVQFDMGKFKDTNELLLSSMWHRIARNSNDPQNQLIAFQNSIDCLEDPKSKWQKVDYMSEFAEWLFINEFPVQDCVDHLEMALDLILDGIKSEKLLVPSSAKKDRGHTDEGGDSEMRKLISDCIDIRSIESLARLHIMIAQVLETTSQKSEHHILTAAYCVQKIWQNAIRNAERALRIGVKPGERPFSRSESKRKDGNKVEKQGSKSCLPTSLDQWVNFALPEKLKEHFQNDTYGYFISKKSLAKLELTVHYLEALGELLRQHGHHAFVLPVCSLLGYIADEILNDKFMIVLARLQLLDVLNDLQMGSGISSVLKSLPCKYLTEEDKAESREEILVWKEKQAQVKAAQMKQNTVGESVSTATSNLVEFCNNKKLIRGVSKRETWTKIAELLIKQGQFNDARELLEEAKQSAEAFDDGLCLAHIEFNYAVISYYECDWGSAVSHLENIQGLEESLKFWLKVILLKVDSYQRSFALDTTFHSHPEVESNDQAILLLHSSIHAIEELFRTSPNRFSYAIYVVAALKARLASYLLKTTTSLDDGITLQISELLEECVSTHQTLGFRRDALRTLKQKAELYHLRASLSSGESKRSYLMKCYEVLEEAVSVARGITERVPLPKNEMSSICLPIEEELLSTQLRKICLCHEILREMTDEEREKTTRNSSKGFMDELLEEYVASTPVFTEQEADWNAITSVVAEEALTSLMLVLSSSEKYPQLQARAALYMGKCLHQIALQRFPDLKKYDASQMKGQCPEANLPSMPENETALKEDPQNQTEKSGFDDQRASPSTLRRKERDETVKQKYADYTIYITQAIEYLHLASQIGLRNGFKEVIARSSYALVECIGARDPVMSAQHLALFQTANSAITIGEIAQRLFLDPHLSRIAGLTQQRRSLQKTGSCSGESHGICELSLEMLQSESEAWRRLHISRSHFDIIKELPFQTTFLVMQHSPDRRTLHVAILEKPKSNVQVGKKKDATVAPTNRSRICSTKVSKDLLNSLKSLAEQFKADVASLLVRKRYLKQQKEKRQEMLGLSESGSKTPEKETDELEVGTAAEEKRLQSNFEDLVTAMEAYFGRILGQIQESLVQDSVAETIVLLADSDLLQLPLEALPIFRHPEIKSVSRDLSLQIFSHRITQGELLDQQNGKLERSKLGKKDKVDTKAKSEKIGLAKKGKATKELVFGKDGVQLDMSYLRYIVDPRCDWPIGDKKGPDAFMSELVLQLKQKAAKWVGLNGHDRMPSIPELQKFIQDSPCLIFYGFERFFAHIPPQFVAPLCLTDCHLIAVMDNMRTLKSSYHQGKLDAHKCPTDLALERPLETATTLSLCGAPCILSNQWQCELGDNNLRLHAVLEGLCESSFTVGQALHISRNPKTVNGLEQTEQEGVDSYSEKASSSQGKQKSDSKQQRLQRRNSQSGSLRSSKISGSPNSSRYSKRDTKQKLESTLKEENEQNAPGRAGVELPSDSHETVLPYERYNTVLYGLPHFLTAPQSGS